MLGSLPDLLQYYIRGGGVSPIYYNITLYYVIYEEPLITFTFSFARFILLQLFLLSGDRD